VSFDGGHSDWKHPSLGYRLTDRTEDVDAVAVHAFLTTSYWAKGIAFDVVERSIKGAHCFSVFDESGAQVGFARVISDHATFGYIGDLYVLEAHRGKGLGVWLMECIMCHSQLQGLRKWTLATRDMHPLYEKFGFTALDDPKKSMELRRKQP
jgi:GNAT superfamily N-acetyltransferase